MGTGLAIALVLLFAAGAARADDRDVVAASINQFIVPGYERLAEEAGLQSDRMTGLCAEPGEAALAAARVQFSALVRAWSQMEIIRFGPIVADNRLERMFFWPDRRGIGLRQVQVIIAEENPGALDAVTLRTKSVAVQGLGALEFVLHGAGAETLAGADGAFRCAYGSTIAGAIETLAEGVAADWLAPDGIAARLVDPSPDLVDYRSEAEVWRELVGVFVHGTELVRDTRLNPFLGSGDDSEANPRLAPYWRSQLTLASLAAGMEAMRSLFVVSGLEEALTGDNRFAAGAFIFELDNFASAIVGIDPDLEAALADQDMRVRLRYLVILTRSLQNIVVLQIAVALGVSAGFSARGGD
ncbi:MAG: imelysin family protein [Cucumibacter sp.]